MNHLGLPKRGINCSSLEELEAATQAWWNRFKRFEDERRYSWSNQGALASKDEALRFWKECRLILSEVQSGRHSF